MSGRDRGGRGRGDRGAAGRGGYEPRGGRGRGGQDDRGGSFGPSRGRGERGGFVPRAGGRGGGGGGPQVFLPDDSAVPALDKKVTEVEDATQKVPAKGGKPDLLGVGQLSLDERLPRRPGYGTKGIPVLLWANYFQLIPGKDIKLYRYNVDIDPEVVGRKRQRLMQLLLSEGRISSFGNGIASDYKSTLICCRRIPAEDLQVNEAVIYRFENEDEPNANARTYRFKLQETGVFTVSEMIDFLTSTNASAAFAEKHEVTQALNIVLGHHPKSASSIMSVGANKHFSLQGASSQSYNLGAGLQAWRGYFTSVRAAASRILLNVQVKHSATYEAIPLDQLMDKYASANGPNLYKLEKFLKKVRIETNHLPVKRNRAGQIVPRVKTINGLATSSDGQGSEHPPKVRSFGASSRDVEFFLGDQPGSSGGGGADDGGSAAKPSSKKGGKKAGKTGGQPETKPGTGQTNKYISVYEFFKTNHGRQVRTNLPVVNVGNKANPSYLPADVCIVLPGQTADSKLSPDQTARMIEFAVRKPFDNARSIATDGTAVLGLNPQNPILAQFGISASMKMITVPGRILNGPNVRYKNNSVASTRFGSWNMDKIQFTTGATLHAWSVLWISVEGVRDAWDNGEALNHTLKSFHDALRMNGVFADAPIVPGPRIRVNDRNCDAAIDETFKKIIGHPKKPELMLVILPKADVGIYNRVKFCGDIVYGIHTICVVGSKFAKRKFNPKTQNEGYDLQYFANVALKFNLKKGGTNQSLEPAKYAIVSDGKTMLVGIDVTHPSPGSAPNAPSIAGMVASVDRWLGQWPAALRVQEARKEMVTDLSDLLKSRLRLWRKVNSNVLPENIIIYRDGVSEGQYQTVISEELPLLRQACTDEYPATDSKKGHPRISIIIVGKRHNTRFYPTRTDANVIDERSSNPKNGTVVDRGVTETRNWEFYLQAHTAIQGTARPAHYFIVHDEIFAKRPVPPPFQNAADVLEDLTHNMCYMFGRATKAVSICPPAYYADLVCERARCYMSKIFDATPEATPTPSLAGGGGRQLDTSLVRVHERLKDTMFYI